MHIVSYRGPAEAGGVSKLIQTGIKSEHNSWWWHLSQNYLQVRCYDSSPLVARVSDSILQGHYRYANEFIWPLMHQRPDLARYHRADHEAFQALNLAVAVHLFSSLETSNEVFINDYQFASLPSYLSNRNKINLTQFWHIPWPNKCWPFAEALLVEIAKGLLCNSRLGFHTQEYVDNFCNFVQEFLPDSQVRSKNSLIITPQSTTELVVCPAGIDHHQWYQLSSNRKPSELALPYILSVDRADYTKGVYERLEGIRRFFQDHPEQRQKIQFVFICQPTRKGLQVFDDYWAKCRALYDLLLRDISTADWCPLVWIEESQPMEELAAWYGNAKALLVNPNVDGLNLTAKEFAACNQHGSIILSTGAGVFKEFKNYVVPISNNQPDCIAFAINSALSLSSYKCRSNQAALRKILRKNSLNSWWKTMTATRLRMPFIAQSEYSAARNEIGNCQSTEPSNQKKLA